MQRQLSRENPQLALLRQLSERLTSAGKYLKPLQHRPATATGDTDTLSTDVVDQAPAQLDEAGEIVADLRHELSGSSPTETRAGRSYRVCFMNRFARGRNTLTACQRSIVVPTAESREAAVEAAKQRFAELEGIPDWSLHASFIEAGLLENDAAAASTSAPERARKSL